MFAKIVSTKTFLLRGETFARHARPEIRIRVKNKSCIPENWILKNLSTANFRNFARDAARCCCLH